MRLREIIRLRRTPAGDVPMEVLQALGIPMPEDVLEQFVHDHGTKWEFQEQYGGLDLHALEWSLTTTPAAELLACSVFPGFAEYLADKAAQAHDIPAAGWGEIPLPPGAADHWRHRGTWGRPPVLLRGELVGSDRPLHLVEGHTRVGMLRGLVEAGVLAASSRHEAWIGETGGAAEAAALSWREVLLRERMPFLDWLMQHVGDKNDLGVLADRLLKAKYSSAWQGPNIVGDDLGAVLAFAGADPPISNLSDAIIDAHAEWEIFTGK